MRSILLLCLLAVLAGAECFTEIALFGVKKLALLRRFRPLKDGTPTHDHLGDILATLDAEQFQAWIAAVTGMPAGVIAIDGKTARRSGKKGDAKASIHMVSAFAARQRLVLGQVKVAEKSNEIIAIPKLFDMLVIEGAIITIDAMGCQRDIAQKVMDKKADYVLALKGNQGSLREDVELFAREQKARGFTDTTISQDTTIDGDHGRNRNPHHHRHPRRSLATRAPSLARHVVVLENPIPVPFAVDPYSGLVGVNHPGASQPRQNGGDLGIDPGLATAKGRVQRAFADGKSEQVHEQPRQALVADRVRDAQIDCQGHDVEAEQRAGLQPLGHGGDCDGAAPAAGGAIAFDARHHRADLRQLDLIVSGIERVVFVAKGRVAALASGRLGDDQFLGIGRQHASTALAPKASLARAFVPGLVGTVWLLTL